MAEIIDLVVLEPFMMDQGAQSRGWSGDNCPKSVEEALQLAEDYMVADAKGDNPRREKGTGTPQNMRTEGGQRVRRGGGSTPKPHMQGQKLGSQRAHLLPMWRKRPHDQGLPPKRATRDFKLPL